MPDKRYDQVTTDDVGNFRTVATGAAGGSSLFAFTAAQTEQFISIWDAALASTTSGDRADGLTKALATLDLTHPGASAAYDYIVTVFGFDSMPAAFTYADYRNPGTVVMPPTRVTRASATLGAMLMQWIHCFPIYGVCITSTTAHAGAGGSVKTRIRFQKSGDRVQ